MKFAVAAMGCAAALALSGCKPSAAPTSESMAERNRTSEKKPYEREGIAVWYAVPADSLAQRRAGKDELTAAHNRLPLGTMVRVTHLANNKSVIVRITDRGVSNHHFMIDLCKEAAEQLDMVSEGSARVRLEVLPDDKSVSAVPNPKESAAQP